jgi:glycosyltransferase involved in cell wall biosynthesis
VSRILFLVSSMQGGGAERVAALLSNHWAAHGHEVVLMPTFSGRGACLYELDERVRLDYLADRVGKRGRSVVNQLRRFVALRKAMREIAPDTILSFLPHVNVAAIQAAAGLGVPVVVSERIHPPAMPLDRGLETMRRLMYARAAAVVVQTQRSIEWLVECCPRARGRVIANPVVYPLPVGEPEIDPGAVVDGSRRAAMALGRLDSQKGFDLLLPAFASVAERHPEWDLVILGEGPERERLEAQREGLGLAGRVHLPGRAGNVGDWYARADLFVMSSRFEGFPNTLIEAMAHGLSVVSFDCDTGPADIVRHGVDGYLVAPSEGVDGLASAMDRLMEDEDKREQMGTAGVAVRERLAPERIMAAWDEVLGLNEAGADV